MKNKLKLHSIILIIGTIAIFMGLMLNVLPNIVRRAREEESELNR